MIKILFKFSIIKKITSSIMRRYFIFFKKKSTYYKIQGIEMFLNFLDPVDKEIILTKEYETRQINILINNIKKYHINYFIDIGANCGYYSLLIAKNIQKIKVISFEPNIEEIKKFKKSLQKNFLLQKKIHLKEYGLANKNSKYLMRSLVKYGYAQSSGSSIEKYNNKSISNVIRYFAEFKRGDNQIKITKKIISVKIDVEGSEIDTLKGLKKLLTKNKIFLQIEIFDENFNKVNNFLKKNNFKINNKIISKAGYADYYYKNFLL